MDKELRAHLLERLSHRAERLAKCSAATHPAHNIDGVLAMMAGAVTRTAIVLLGETFGKEMFEYVFDQLTEASGICRFCRARPLRDDRTMCQFCWDEAQSDDDITDEDLSAVAQESAKAGAAVDPHATK